MPSILCKELDSLKTSLDEICDVSIFVTTERQKVLDRQKQEKRELEDKYKVENKEVEDKHIEELKILEDQIKTIFRKMRSLFFNCDCEVVICGECEELFE